MEVSRSRSSRFAMSPISFALVAAFALAGCGGGRSAVTSALPSDGTRTAQTGLVGNAGGPLNGPTCGCKCDLSTVSTSNFDGTKIAAGSAIWFNAVAKIKGVAAGDTVFFNNQQVTIGGGAPIYLPDADITFGGTASHHASYDDGSFTWTVAAGSADKNVFVGGFLYQVPADIPGGQNPVIWSGHFHLPHGASVQWQWAAAVYGGVDSFLPHGTPGMNGLDVLAYDGANGGEHAGTPDAIRHDLLGGARGGKGSNFTGSYSGTFSAFCPIH